MSYNHVNLYISHITPNLKGQVVSQEDKICERPLNDRDNCLFALYEEYDMLDQGLPQRSSLTEPTLISIQAASDLGLAAALKLSNKEPDLFPQSSLLIYCHETVEPSLYLTPAIKLKKELKMKRTLPFAVSQQGSAAFIGALQTTQILWSDAPPTAQQTAVIITADQLAPPQMRSSLDVYPKGDCSVACLVSSTPREGAYFIESMDIASFVLNKEATGKDLLLDAASDLLQRAMASWGISYSELRMIIPQSFDSTLHAVLAELSGGQTPIYRRTFAPTCNLLTSDCLVSLEEAHKREKFLVGDLILLLFVGPLHTAGVILLRKLA
ncbi:hypothetical protein [Paenibacillus sp. FSL H8-0537]|uniref:hypothetical protein n=1 Tax=Paenibacillus sp. FSL H8-0537 TaxID=2921399 RepID=UPI003100BB7D